MNIYHQLKKIMACWLTILLALVQPACALAGRIHEAEFLNDRSASIIGSTPLQIPGLVIPEGLTGKGVIVGLADSGLDRGSLTDIHPDLQSTPGRIPRVVMLKSYSGREVPDDPVGHGTHMAGTMVGNGASSDGQYKGIAPGASLYVQALLNKDGELKIPANLEELYDPAYAAGVRIHVNGWGEDSNTYGSHTAQVDRFVYQHSDFLPIFGAGNDGPGQGTLSSEANSKNALVVGSSQTMRPVFSPEAVDAKQVAESSSQGPTQDGRTKPDLVAPGSAVISLCSSLTKSNYEANPSYTSLGGTSMATAITGGSTAMLVDYLKNQKKISQPSSALLKALLINGARSLDGGHTIKSGYGILDLAGTILPLKEGCFVIADGQKDLNQGDFLEYHFQVADTSRPFKATLAWVDPPSASGSPGLVNNLDLEVVDPQGKILLGNDNNGQNVSDRQNNVEQIAINKPMAGQYTIRIRAANLAGKVWSSHYSLIFGQALQHDVVSKVDIQANKLFLASGASLDLGLYSIKAVNNGHEYSSSANIKTGSDIYINEKLIYLFGEEWESGGIQVLQQDQGTLLVEMNPAARQGGYFLDLNSKISLMLNGKPVEQASDIPAGVKIIAAVNPQVQTIRSLKASYSMVTGYIEKVDWTNRQIKLFQDENVYKIASWCALTNQDSLLDSSDMDLPYGSINTAGDNTLTTGVKVSMTVSPSDKEVQCIKTERRVVVSRVANLNSKTGEINTEDGKTYKVFPGSKIFRDGKAASLKDIQAGDKISGVLLKDINQIIELQVYSNIIYGRVVYYNPEQATVYMFDSKNQFLTLHIPDLSYIISGGIRAGTTLGPGKWVRAVLNAGSTDILRADLAEEKQEDTIKVFRYFDPEQQLIYMTDGSSYRISAMTQMTKSGYNINPDLLGSGDQIVITTLDCPGSAQEFLARAEVKISSGAQPPTLEATASNLNNVLVIRGSTTGNKVGVIRQDGKREPSVQVNNDGSFSLILPLQQNEQTVSVLAVDTRTGGLIGENLEVMSFNQTPLKTFLDLKGNPDRTSIERLANREILSGFGDGSYRPGGFIDRADFLTMLGQVGNWQVEKSKSIKYFTDNGDIPDWALGPIYFARERGFVSGYPDGTFRPGEALTRGAMVTMMAKVIPGDLHEKAASNLPYKDSQEIPAWAVSSYQLFNQRGWLDLFGGSYLEPDRQLTRGEAARFIDRIMSNVQSNIQSGI